MYFRHELKHEINLMDMLIIRQRMNAIAKKDAHSDGKYIVKSLYFDTPNDKVLREKMYGLNNREKFRLRYYNEDLSMIRLEKKGKVNSLTSKESAILTKKQVTQLLDGDYSWVSEVDSSLVMEFYSKVMSEGLQPKNIVVYTREAYTYEPGNVRVTIDYDIRTGLDNLDFFDGDLITIPAKECPIILEVKWDEMLPQIIIDALQLGNRKADSFSKYATSRLYY